MTQSRRAGRASATTWGRRGYDPVRGLLANERYTKAVCFQSVIFYVLLRSSSFWQHPHPHRRKKKWHRRACGPSPRCTTKRRKDGKTKGKEGKERKKTEKTDRKPDKDRHKESHPPYLINTPSLTFPTDVALRKLNTASTNLESANILTDVLPGPALPCSYTISNPFLPLIQILH